MWLLCMRISTFQEYSSRVLSSSFVWERLQTCHYQWRLYEKLLDGYDEDFLDLEDLDTIDLVLKIETAVTHDMVIARSQFDPDDPQDEGLILVEDGVDIDQYVFEESLPIGRALWCFLCDVDCFFASLLGKKLQYIADPESPNLTMFEASEPSIELIDVSEDKLRLATRYRGHIALLSKLIEESYGFATSFKISDDEVEGYYFKDSFLLRGKVVRDHSPKLFMDGYKSFIATLGLIQEFAISS